MKPTLRAVATALLLIASRQTLAASETALGARDPLATLGLSVLDTLPRDDNAVVSPYSLGAAVSLLAFGGSDATRSVLEGATGIAAINNPKVRTLTELDNRLTSRAAAEGITLEIANAVWADTKADILPDYIEAARRNGGAPTERIDLTSPAAMTRVNRWVDKTTKGLIPALLDKPPQRKPGGVTVVNALYFRAAWEIPFDAKETKHLPFHVGGKPDVPADLMSKSERFRYREDPDFQAVELPFGNAGGFSLIVVLPKDASKEPATLPAVAGSRLTEAFGGDGFDYRQGTIRLPRLEISQTLYPLEQIPGSDLAQALKAPGALSRLFRTQLDPLNISSVQKLTVSLDETGAVAAAATAEDAVSAALTPPETQPPFELTANRPFWFALRENYTHTLLMLGVIRNPKDENQANR
jgi:serine protease inhibitor